MFIKYCAISLYECFICFGFSQLLAVKDLSAVGFSWMSSHVEVSWTPLALLSRAECPPFLHKGLFQVALERFFSQMLYHQAMVLLQNERFWKREGACGSMWLSLHWVHIEPCSPWGPPGLIRKGQGSDLCKVASVILHNEKPAPEVPAQTIIGCPILYTVHFPEEKTQDDRDKRFTRMGQLTADSGLCCGSQS